MECTEEGTCPQCPAGEELVQLGSHYVAREECAQEGPLKAGLSSHSVNHTPAQMEDGRLADGRLEDKSCI